MGSSMPFTNDPALIPKGARYLDSAFGKVKKPGLADWIRYYGVYASLYYFCEINDTAILYNDSIIMLIDHSGQDTAFAVDYANTCYALGDNYLRLGNYQKAFGWYYKGMSTVTKNLDECSASNYNYRIAIVLYRQGNYSEAISYFQVCLAQLQNCQKDFPLFYRQQELLNNIALSYTRLKMYDSAMTYYNKALAFLRENETDRPHPAVYKKVASGVIYGNMAKVFRARGEYERAEELLKESVKLNLNSDGEIRDAQGALIELAHVYYDQHRLDDTWRVLQDARKTLDTIANEQGEGAWTQMMWMYYRARNDYRNAFSYLQKASLVKDSLEARDRMLKQTDIRQQQLMLENQTENEILRKENRERRFTAWITILFAVMLLLILGLIYISYRRSRRNVEELSALHMQVSDQKKQLERTLDELKERDKDRDRIMRVVAHDLRNPISAVTSLSLLMQQDLEGSDHPHRELVGLIHTSCTNTLNLIEELLEATDTSKSSKLEPERIDLNHLLQNSADLLQFRAMEKKQHIELKPLDRPAEIMADREKIWRVLSNLLVNAIKFSPEGSTIRMEARLLNGQVEIGIHDKGIGIPDELKPRVFDSFTSAKRPGTSGEKAFGLGLSIARQFVEAHNGRIWFESEVGKGTCFYVSLPLAS